MFNLSSLNPEPRSYKMSDILVCPKKKNNRITRREFNSNVYDRRSVRRDAPKTASASFGVAGVKVTTVCEVRLKPTKTLFSKETNRARTG